MALGMYGHYSQPFAGTRILYCCLECIYVQLGVRACESARGSLSERAVDNNLIAETMMMIMLWAC